MSSQKKSNVLAITASVSSIVVMLSVSILPEFGEIIFGLGTMVMLTLVVGMFSDQQQYNSQSRTISLCTSVFWFVSAIPLVLSIHFENTLSMIATAIPIALAVPGLVLAVPKNRSIVENYTGVAVLVFAILVNYMLTFG